MDRKKYKNKVIYHVHNEVGSAFGCEKLIVQSKFVLGISNYVNQTLKKRFPNLDDKKLKILHNTINLEELNKVSKNGKKIRKKYKISEDTILVLFVGRICRDKGIEQLVDAFSKLRKKNLKLMIVGNYYFGTNLMSDFEKKIYAKTEEFKEKVIFTGFVPNKNIGAYYGAADIVVLPSMWEEPAGLTMIESMASSSGVTITTNSGGIPEYVGKKNGIILDKDRDDFIENLANEINRFAMDKDIRRIYNELGKNKAEEYNYIDYVERFEECINGKI